MAWRSWSSTSSRESFCRRVIASRRAANPFRDGLFVLSNFAHASNFHVVHCASVRIATRIGGESQEHLAVRHALARGESR